MERIKEWIKLHAVLVTVLLCGTVMLCQTAFQEDRNIQGVVVELQAGEDGNLASLVLEQDGKRTGVIMTENTRAWPRERVSWQSYEELRQLFQEELQIDTEVSAWCSPFQTKLETAEGRITAYRAKSAYIVGSLERNALTLRDETAVDILSSDPGFRWIYRLPDGTELLRVEAPIGDPASACVNGDEAFGTLSDKARKKILAYYAEQKPLYDEREELEKCYAEWRELGEEFSPGYIQQNVWLKAYNEKVLYFETLAALPGGGNPDISLGAAFDRESGEKLDFRQVFAVPEEEICRRLPELVGWIDDESIRVEMAKVLKPEWIVVSEEGLTVQFPAGSLSSFEDQAYLICVEPQKVMEAELLQPWAIPYNW
ncbi:hypothetical protein [uncultured Oscillibacter sp.]|uniref:hypothetical protein n=1 Tax=uncultured Oscillibacter sp. TaxID=876091 RepID=UPI00260CDE91|nr:hypothetical protein [uncultured Oscillibacter sp.]